MLGSAGCGEEGRDCCVSERCATASLDAPAQPVVENEELNFGTPQLKRNREIKIENYERVIKVIKGDTSVQKFFS